MVEIVLADLEKMDDFVMIYETSDNLEAIEFLLTKFCFKL